MKIGFFDSGLGGLTILTAVRELLPQYDYLYFGDTKNLPFGDKSEEVIRTLTREGIEKLFRKGAGLVIVACNTASAESVREIQKEITHAGYGSSKKVLGVVIPTIESIIDGKLKRPLILGTTRTIESKKYENELFERSTYDLEIKSLATPELVPLIETDRMQDALTVLIKKIDPLAGDIDSIVLACTHYTVLKKGLREQYGERITIVSQDEVIPRKLLLYLEGHPEIRDTLSVGGSIEIELSGETSVLEKVH